MKLPKTDLRKFSGEELHWPEFWNIFRLSIHDNPEIPTVQKFVYLKSLLTNEASGYVANIKPEGAKLLNYFITIGKLYLWDCRSKQILPNIYGFRAKIIAKYETEEKISNKEFFFKRKWILTPYLS